MDICLAFFRIRHTPITYIVGFYVFIVLIVLSGLFEATVLGAFLRFTSNNSVQSS